MKKIGFILFVLLIILPACTIAKFRDKNIIDLSGEWEFAVDSLDRGIEEQWYMKNLSESVKLPGSMTENRKGKEVNLETDWTGSIVDSSYFYDEKYVRYRKPGNFKIPFWLKPLKHYRGAAWYQKTITIPGSWKGKRISLYLERCHWQTTVYVDDHLAGSHNSLSVPHDYDLTEFLDPGKHILTVRVDNRMIIPVGINSHSVSDHTQTNWNGIIGRILLKAENPVFIDDIQIYPHVMDKNAETRIVLLNPEGKDFKGLIEIQAAGFNSGKSHVVEMIGEQINISEGKKAFSIHYRMGDEVQLWSEFNPALYHLTVSLKDSADNVLDKKVVNFGMREFKAEGTRFSVNGHPVFLRGTVECCIFPLTGYPPTDTASWDKVFATCKDYGLNHMRFHSWCPPEAAFQAADKYGFYLQVECDSWANWPNSSLGDGLPVDQFIYEEGDRIMKEYGNHPSFCMMAYGNEPGGDSLEVYLTRLLKYWKAKDRRRVYTGGAGWPYIKENDYHNGADPRIQHWEEGLASIINAQPPQTMFDYRDFLSKYNVPWVSHEIGQWCVYPDFNEIQEYKGTLRATNFEIFRETLEENQMGDQAEDFLLASGELQVQCYKADIEAALRTPGFAGFQLLQLHDFPGQGTALVGVTNAFFEPKEYVTPVEFRQFCNRTVPLVRMEKRIFRNNEVFDATLELSHFGEQPLNQPVIEWIIYNQEGTTLREGNIKPGTINIGNCISLGEISMPLNDINIAQKLTLTVRIAGTEFVNNWDFWVYPSDIISEEKDVYITYKLDEQTNKNLAQGKSVLLLAYGKIMKGKGAEVAIGFSSIFWNTAWTNGQPPHTLGILCEPDNPVFNEFPTEFYSNWQWWDLVSHAQAMILGGFPPELRPLIQPIDTWFENRRLALLFEVKAGQGKLMVCSIDLESDLDKRPVAKQLKSSILKYMNSPDFNPEVEVDISDIRELIQE